jgi:precorrin-2 dehydrogenase/sirohydrochlorin ferrochelatase
MRAYYPVFLDLQDQPCLVVGGGLIAQRKVEGLCEAGARVRVVAPEILPMPEGAECITRAFEPSDLDGMRLVIAATDDREVNAVVAQQARAHGLFVNAVDDPAECSFILPALVRRGDLVLAISTGGQSPILARRIKEQLEAHFGPEYAELTAMLGRLRRTWLEDPRTAPLTFDQRREVWEDILDLPLIEWMKAGREEDIEAAVRERLEAATQSTQSQR